MFNKYWIIRFGNDRILEFSSQEKMYEYVWYFLRRPNLVYIEEWNSNKLLNKEYIYLGHIYSA
jgi:hypothetical protein